MPVIGGVTVSRETIGDLEAFSERFHVWNSRLNLVAASTEADFWSRHIVDSAQLLALAPDARRWLDLGSGGGFPGLVVAFLLRECGGSIALIESNRKKCGFLQAIVGEFGLPAVIHPVRIESAAQEAIAEVVTARALAHLPKLLDLASSWLTNGAVGLFHKGREFRSELAQADSHWRFDLVEHSSVVEEGSVILQISDLKKAARE